VKGFARQLSLAFAAGAAGGLASCLALWALAASGLAGAIGVRVAPALAPEWLVPRLVWGGLWGLLFLLPLASQRWVVQGLALSLVPSFLHFFARLPSEASAVVLGPNLGAPAALVVLAANASWGLAAAAWLHATGR
jgi:hypothetical protein